MRINLKNRWRLTLFISILMVCVTAVVIHDFELTSETTDRLHLPVEVKIIHTQGISGVGLTATEKPLDIASGRIEYQDIWVPGVNLGAGVFEITFDVLVYVDVTKSGLGRISKKATNKYLYLSYELEDGTTVIRSMSLPDYVREEAHSLSFIVDHSKD